MLLSWDWKVFFFAFEVTLGGGGNREFLKIVVNRAFHGIWASLFPLKHMLQKKKLRFFFSNMVPIYLSRHEIHSGIVSDRF